MAITAACAISSASATFGQRRTVTCTVTNGNASAVVVTAVNPVVCPTGELGRQVAVSVGRPNILPPASMSIAGSSGTLAITWEVVAHSPGLETPNLSMPTSQIYDCGATINTSDGSITTADVVTLTVAIPT